MKKIAIRFKMFGKERNWYPIQTLIAIVTITILMNVIETSTTKVINYIETNYEVDNKGTLSVYDDSFVRK